MVGLYEAATYLHDDVAMADLTDPDRGFAALKVLLPYYDTGDWTHYYITTPGTLQRGRLQTLGYHTLVIGQLRYLTKITGDPFFAKWADKFQGYLNACTVARPCPPSG
jgi:hypothetical protein